MTLKVKTKHDDCEMILDVEKKDTCEYSLPHGWKKIGKKRRSLSRLDKTSNSRRGDWDFFIISPSGKRFRSTVEVNKYLGAVHVLLSRLYLDRVVFSTLSKSYPDFIQIFSKIWIKSG